MSRGAKAVAVLCCATFFACRSQIKSGMPEPGMDLYAVAVDSVTEVLVSSPAHKIYAYRWATDRSFQLVIASRNGAIDEQCSGGAGFERLLQALAIVPVVRESEKHFESGTAAWAYVLLRDTTNLEPIEARIRIPEAKGEPVVIQFGDRQYVVKVDPTALQTSNSGCAELGRKP